MAVANDLNAITAAGWAIGGGVLGLIAGSFLATITIRWPEGRSVAAGRSSCDDCGRPLRAAELVPLLSFLIQRGRCRTCHATIDRRHPLIEAACCAIGIVALLVQPNLAGFAGALFGWLLVTLAVLDIEHHWLPDRLTLPLAILGLGGGLIGLPPAPPDRAIGAMIGFGGLWLIGWLYLRLRGREGLGGGDPKLFGAIGAWLGWQSLPFVLLASSLAGLVWVLVMMTRGQAVSATTRLPFGALLAIAAFPVWMLMSLL